MSNVKARPLQQRKILHCSVARGCRTFPLGKKQYSLRHTGHCASVTSRLRRWFDKGHLHRVTAPFSLRQPNVNAGQEAPPSDPF